MPSAWRVTNILGLTALLQRTARLPQRRRFQQINGLQHPLRRALSLLGADHDSIRNRILVVSHLYYILLRWRRKFQIDYLVSILVVA